MSRKGNLRMMNNTKLPVDPREAINYICFNKTTCFNEICAYYTGQKN